MKKKIFSLICIICLVGILVGVLTACNPKPDPEIDDPNVLPSAKYTVTFDTNGGSSIKTDKITDVAYGAKVSEPDEKPNKAGYKFEYWTLSLSGTPVKFVFASTSITANTTLYAYYTPVTYNHTVVTDKVLRYSVENGNDKYELVPRTSGTVVLKDANDVDIDMTRFKSTYSQTNSLPCPKIEGSDAQFRFWYYMRDGKPEQLTNMASEGTTEVSLLTSYKFTRGLEIYPMFSDGLPKVTVKYINGISKDENHPHATQEYVFGQNIPKSAPPTVTNPGYSFVKWYYEVTEKDENDEDKTVQNDFVFSDDEENKDKTPTDPSQAAGALNNFKPVTLKIYSKWTKEIVISSTADFEQLRAAIYNEDIKPEVLEQYLTANITFNTNILDFGAGTVIKPLFDEEHTFRGVIDGGENEDARTTVRGIFAGSVFGYNAGTIKNLNFITEINVAEADGVIYAGGVVSKNSGFINNCKVDLNKVTLPQNSHAVVGGVAAVNTIVGTSQGMISKCTVTFADAVMGNMPTLESFVIGGVVGETNAKTVVSGVKVTFILNGVKCEDDGNGNNGLPYLIAGGIAGRSNGTVSDSEVTATVTKIDSNNEFVFGGVVGVSLGRIKKTSATVNVGVDTDKANQSNVFVSGSSVRFSAIGGLLGKNEGSVFESFARVNLNVIVKDGLSVRTTVAVGGLVGYNVSTRGDESAKNPVNGSVKQGFAAGNINVAVLENTVPVDVYIGGLLGRNAHKNLESLFADVNISLAAYENAVNNIGYVCGSQEVTPIENGYRFYGETSELKLNGEQYVKDGENENFKVTTVGNATDNANFKNEGWVVGSGSEESQVKFDSSWQVKADENDGYPSFKPATSTGESDGKTE